ncbi:MAG: 3-oxoacid CoA-transferase [Elusimicrobia bacterium]|nr:3-oxoacid CoA-transferase [Elusimicrobiota bacterium]
MSAEKANATERLACTAARLMKGRTTVFIGTGVPMLAASLARALYAPSLIPVFEFGGVGSTLEKLPLAVGEHNSFRRGVAAMGICDVMEAAQRGVVRDGFLGGAQIDPYGNLNTTVIGPYDDPAVRLPGSGGANDVGSLCWRTIIIMKHERKRFVPKVDFLTTPGYLDGPGARERAGLPPETGPYRVVTDLAVFDFDPGSKRMRLIALNPGVTTERVAAETGFPFPIADRVTLNADPTPLELRTLRRKIDPDKVFL